MEPSILKGEARCRRSGDRASKDEYVHLLEHELAHHHQHLLQLEGRLARTTADLEAILRSRAWRLTLPLRLAAKLVRFLAARRRSGWGLRTFLKRRLLYCTPQVRQQGRMLRSTNLFEDAHYLEQSPDVSRWFTDPVLHYLLAGAKEGRDPHPLFDTSYYLERNPDVAAAGLNPLLHYWSVGAAQGRDPHPLFDSSYYLERNGDVAAAGVTPLAHYWSDGAREGRDPHPLFDTSYYLERNPDVAAAGVNPLLHYWSVGAAQRRDPHPLFDTAFYLAHNPDVVAGVNPLAHYCADGAKEGRDPHPLFDSSYYLERNEDVAAAGINPLAHYCTAGAGEGRDPHPLFDSSYYLERNGDVAAAGVNPLAHYWSDGAREGRDPHPLFSAGYYLQGNPPAAARVNPLLHYCTAGAAQGRDPHPLFDSSYYLEINGDVVAAGVNPLAHYWSDGAKEGRDPHPLFDTSYYLERYLDVAAAGVNPLLHYWSDGAKERRDPHPLFDSSYYLEHYLDVAAAGVNPLQHYATDGGRERRDPHPLFESAYYVAESPDCALSGLNPLVHYLANGCGRQARKVHPSLFDVGFYLRWNDDLPPDMTPLVHFLTRCANRPPRPVSEVGPLQWAERFSHAARGAATGPDEAPEVSIVIPTFHGLHDTLGCIEAVLRQQTKYRYEILVVDDCSTAKALEALPAIRHLRCVRNAVNRGFLQTCKLGARQARGKYLVLLDTDSRPLGPWLDALIDTFAQVPEAGLVGPKLLQATGALYEAGGFLFQDGSHHGYGRGEDRHGPAYNYRREVDYCACAAVALPRELWERLGDFAADLPAHGEACALALRVREAGCKVVYQPLAEVVHFSGAAPGCAAPPALQARRAASLERLFECWKHRLCEYSAPDADLERARDRRAAGRILFIDHITPAPDQDAGSMVAMGVIEALQSLGYKVTFFPDNLAFVPRYTPTLQQMGVECRHAPQDRSIADHLRQHGELYDAVVLARAPIAGRHLDAVAEHAPQARVIFHTIDLHYVREQRQAELEKSLKLGRRAECTRKLELACILRSDCTIVVSKAEKELLAAEMPSANTYCFPYVADVKGCATPFEGRRDLMYLGGFNHPPNVDAVLYFVERIWPLVKSRLPQLKFYIVGSHPPQVLRDLAREDVVVTGLVPDLAEYLDRCRLSVVPLRYGAGIKGKVVSSLSHGVPCVATSIAVEGMMLKEGEEVVVADKPADFAAAIWRLYRDKALWQAMSRRGLEFVEANYSRRQAAVHVRQILESVGLGTKATEERDVLRLVA